MTSLTSPRHWTLIAMGTALGCLMVLFAPAAQAASVSISPGDWAVKKNAVTTTMKGRGQVTRINDAGPKQRHVSGVYAMRPTASKTLPKLDKWVRANHGKPARICAVMSGRVSGVKGAISINGMNKANQATGGGFKQRKITVGPGWKQQCMDFTVITRKHYYGNADVWVQNWESADPKDMYVDYVTLKTR